MTKPPETRIGPAAAVKRGGRLLSPARYRHPGDVIRLIAAGLVLSGALAVTTVTHATYAGASAVAVTGLVPSTLAGRALAGLVQALFALAAVAGVVVTLLCRRFRLLAGLVAAPCWRASCWPGWFTWQAGSVPGLSRLVLARGHG
jgi:hypothetical protein